MFLPPVTGSPHFSRPRYSSRPAVWPNLGSPPRSNGRPSSLHVFCSQTLPVGNAPWPANAPLAQTRPAADRSGPRRPKTVLFIFKAIATQNQMCGKAIYHGLHEFNSVFATSKRPSVFLVIPRGPYYFSNETNADRGGSRLGPWLDSGQLLERFFI